MVLLPAHLARQIVSCAALLLYTMVSYAAEVGINPTRVHLDRNHSIETLTLTNAEARELNFEVEVKRWSQLPDGTWSLQPSDELIVQPLIVRVPARGVAWVRIGTLTPSVVGERPYRVELQQLPDQRVGGGAQITLLTRLSIPVFLQTGDRRAGAALSGAHVQTNAVGMTLNNIGTTYLAPQDGRLRLLDAGGRALKEESIAVGYVLSGAKLPLSRPLPTGMCAKVARIELTLREPAITLRGPVDDRSRRCVR